MTDTKLRILIYGQGHQYAGEIAPDDVLDDPEENKNLLIFEGTPEELLVLANQYEGNNSRYAWKVARTIKGELRRRAPELFDSNFASRRPG